MTKADIIASALAANQNAAFRKALSFLIDWECEYRADGVTIRNEKVPGDAGGLTFAGIDQRSHPDFPYDNPKPSDVWLAYKDDYWTPLRCAEMPSPVALVIFVQGSNQGIGAAARMLQDALNDYGSRLTVDGIIGQNTLQASWKVPDSDGLAMAFLAKSRQRYLKRVAERPDQEKFLNGWLNRVAALKRQIAA
jgi:lysozyme family protein